MALYGNSQSSSLGGGPGSLDSLINERNSLNNSIVTSPSYGGDADPTLQDTANETRMYQLDKQIKQQQKTKAQSQWFPTVAPGATSTQPAQNDQQQPGILSRILDTLSMPLYAIEGAVAYTTGHGQGQNVIDSAVKNATAGHQTFGDLLKQSNVPWAVAAPLGFAMDIGLDPLNWATAGTAALVPRLAVGLGKAGLAGGAAALESSLPARALYKTAGFASKIAEKTPFIGGKVAEAVAGPEGQTLSSRLLGRISNARENYSALTGSQLSTTNAAGKELFGKEITDKQGWWMPKSLADKQGWWNPFSGGRIIFGDIVQNALNKTQKGAALNRFFKYSASDSLRGDMTRDLLFDQVGSKKAMDEALQAHMEGRPPAFGMAKKVPISPAGAKRFGELFPDFGEGATVSDPQLDATLEKLAATPKGVETANAVHGDANALNGAETILQAPEYAVATDPVARAARMVEDDTGAKVTMDQIQKLANDGLLGETGVKWFDDAQRAVEQFKGWGKGNDAAIPIGKKLLDGYKTFISIFKGAKVFQNPSSWMNAMGGNFFLYAMHGMDPTDTRFLSMIKNYNGILRGKSGQQAFLQDIMTRSELSSYMNTYGKTVSGRIGATPVQLAVRAKTEEMLRLAREEGIVPSSLTAGELEPQVQKVFNDLKAVADAGAKSSPEAGKMLLQDAAARMSPGKLGGLESYMEKIRTGAKITQGDLPVSMLGAEFLDNSMTQAMIKKIETEAANPNASPVWKMMRLMFIKSAQGYEKIDQTWRGGSFLHGFVNGYTESELMKMRRTFKFNPEDLVNKWDDSGVMRYRVTPQKSMEIADTAYLNYQAMPGFVRVMRNLPLLGSPFMSFAYGMVAKTGKTLAYNPGFFNKVNYAFNDFGGTQTPLEKQVKQGQYYKYLNQDGMYRLPFFAENPVYVNLASMIPYYSLNFFNPSNRSYKDAMPDKLISMIDQTPFFKDPVGSTLLDYVVQPLILRDSQPVGQFGQPLYPNDAGALQKAMYGLRTGAEAVVPGWAGVVGGTVGGLAESGNIIPRGTSAVIPSYRWRQITNAMQGLNAYGVPFTAENPAVRAGRNIAGGLGVNVTAPLNLTFTPKNGSN